MPATKIADVVVPEQLTKMVSAQISPYMDFVRTGIASLDYHNTKIDEGGSFAEIPFYDQLTGDDEVLTDSSSLQPQKIATRKDIGVVCHRGKAWASRDLATILSGDDPMKEIAKQVAKYWGKRSAEHLISVLNGVFDATAGVLKDTHLNAVGVTTGTKITLSSTNVIGAAQKLGDMMDQFDSIVVHSKVYADMLNEKLVVFPERFDTTSVKLADKGRYLGMDIIVSDYAPVDTTTTGYPLYTSYLCRKGSLYFGMQRELMTETDRDILALKDVLSTNIHFVPHVKLVKWKVTTDNPTNVQLATATNWEKIAEDNKFIGIVALVTN